MDHIATLKIFWLALLMAMAAGCSSSHLFMRQKQKMDGPLYLPGVDSLVAMQSYVITRQLLPPDQVRDEVEQLFLTGRRHFALAESLLVCWQKLIDSAQTTMAMDTVIFQNTYRKAFYLIEGKEKLVNVKRLGIPRDTRRIIARLYEEADVKIEQAIQLNTYDIQLWLQAAQIQMAQARLAGRKKLYRATIPILRKILEFNRSLPDVYIMLGECYRALKQWDQVYQAYTQAQELLSATAFFRSDTMYGESRMVFLLQQRAHACTKQYNDSTALVLLNQAKSIATSLPERSEIESYIRWINWDDGNIRAVEERDAIYQLYRKGEYKQASKRYKKLIRILKTQRTRNFINWKIALIDFSILHRRQEGIARMHRVIQNSDTFTETDSIRQVYRNDYGAMCYAMGAEYLTAKNFKRAYTYFYQASEIDWAGRGKSALELAKLSVVDPQLTIHHCQEALQYRNTLTQNELDEVYELLMHAYKSNGQFALARTYYLRLSGK